MKKQIPCHRFFHRSSRFLPFLDEIRRCVVGEDEIADDASAALSKIRKSIRGMNDRIHAQLTGLMNNTTTRSYLQDAVITMRDGRYCLPGSCRIQNLGSRYGT